MHLNSRLYKLVCSVCLLLSTLAVIMIAGAPASGYEISIYTTNLSPLVWLLLITSIGGSIFLLVFQASDGKDNNWWLIALFTLMFSSLIVLLLPNLKGYYFSSRDDALTHVGYIKDILLTGHFSEHNIYPAQHMLPAALSYVIGLSARNAASYVSPFFPLGYLLAVYLLARTVFHRKGEIILVCVSGAILLIPHSSLLEASRQAALMFPLALALFFRGLQRKTLEYKLLFLLVLILHPFLHPLATFIMLVTLVLFILLQAGHNALQKQEPRREVPLQYFYIFVPISFAWYANLFIFRLATDFLVNLLTLEFTPSPVSSYASLLEKGGVHGLGVIDLLFRFYGGEIIYSMVAAITVLIVARRLIFHRQQSAQMIMIGLLFAALCLTYMMLWLGLAFGYGETYGRLVFYIPTITLVLASFTLYQIIQRWRYRKLTSALVAGLILISAVLSVFNRYPSAYLHNPNLQATHREIEGTEWIVDHRDPSTAVTYTGTSLYRFAVAKHGIRWFHESPVPLDPTFPRPPVRIPDHFGYQHHETIGEALSEKVYLVLTKWDWVLYEEVWKPPIPTRWGKEDFARLEHDHTADRLYANGEFDVWLVQARTSHILRRPR